VTWAPSSSPPHDRPVVRHLRRVEHGGGPVGREATTWRDCVQFTRAHRRLSTSVCSAGGGCSWIGPEVSSVSGSPAVGW
jgi:hypothetical protein